MARTATFEAGSNGADITTAAGEASLSAWALVGGAPLTYSNTHAAHGSLSAKIDDTGNFSWVCDALTEHYGRMYLYPTANPNADTDIMFFGGGGDIIYTAAGKLTIIDGSGGANNLTTTNSLVNNQWNRFEYHIICSATVGQFELKLFTSADAFIATETISSPSTWNTGTSLGNVQLGCIPGYTASPTYWIDDIVVEATSWPGPIYQASASGLRG